ncbi:MAG: hypothetical protein AABZ02_13480, partial [Bacteroidota bacterium]
GWSRRRWDKLDRWEDLWIPDMFPKPVRSGFPLLLSDSCLLVSLGPSWKVGIYQPPELPKLFSAQRKDLR